MRTLIIILAGFMLWAACLGTARLLTGIAGSSMTTATLAFIAVWFVATVVNMWIGITQAGYSFRDELPIILVIFLLPVLTAVLVKWKFLQ